MKLFELCSRLKFLKLTLSYVAYVEINCKCSYVYVYTGISL